MLAFPLIPFLIIGLLVMANAFLATAEFALVSVRRTWLQQKADAGDRSAEAALKLSGDLNSVISGTQLGITMMSLALGWVGEDTIAGVIEQAIDAGSRFSQVLIHGFSLTVAFVFVTFIHLVLGELVPKQVALGRAESMSLVVAWPMTVFLKIVRAPMRLLHSFSFAIACKLGARAGGRSTGVATAEELKLLVASSTATGGIPATQQEMIHRIIDLNDVTVREIMVPRPNIISISVDFPLEEVVRIVTEDQHSRIPVFEGSPEHIIGVLYSKDLLKVWDEETRIAKHGGKPRSFALRTLVRELLVTLETKPIDQLLNDFQQRRRHMALVVDEYGSTVGIVTVEDVLEQIVGEIEDEFDWEIPPGLRVGEHTLMLDARVTLLDLESQYEIELPRDMGYATLAGFVLQQLGHIPQPGESFLYDSRRFTVLAMEDLRVARVKVEKQS